MGDVGANQPSTHGGPFRAFLEAAPDAMVIVASDGRIVFVNGQTESLFGYTRDELIGAPVEKLVPLRSRARHEHYRVDYIGDPKVRGMGSGRELFGLRKDGTEFPVEISLSPVETEDGVLISSAIRDVTERKRAEARTRFAAIVESSDDAIYSRTFAGRIEIWNAAAERLFGYTAAEIVQCPPWQLIPEGHNDETNAILEQTKYGVAVDAYDTVRVRRDGTLVEVSISISPIRNDAGEITAAAVIARDITRAKDAERRLRASLREKEVLLKEVHHRVKNNLQVISSLLSLQSVREACAPGVFAEMQNRVRSISLFHEKMYQANDLAHVQAGEYLTDVAHALVSQYGADRRITLDLDTRHVELGVDQAIPCGLVANELITNALKYAFPEGRPGTIFVILRREGERCRLSIADDGVGLPEHVDIRHTQTLGLQLVCTLSEQLEAELVVNRKAGTEITLYFPTNSPRVEQTERESWQAC